MDFRVRNRTDRLRRVRILFATFPARAHVHNVVPLAWACALAGHDVRIGCHPDLLGVVTAAGLVGVPVGGRTRLSDMEVPPPSDPDFLDRTSGLDTRDAPELRPQRDFLLGAVTLFLGAAAAQADATADLADLARTWRPDLVVFDQIAFHGAVAARACGAPAARLLFGVDHGERLRRRFLDAGGAYDLLAVLAGSTLARHGLEFDEGVLHGDWTIDPVPRGIQVPTGSSAVSMRNVPYTGGLAAGRDHVVRTAQPRWPRVCVTFGYSGREVWHGEERIDLRAVLERAARPGTEVVTTLSAEQRSAVGALPDAVRVLDYVPLTALLPTCRAAVHRGGLGTMAAAALHRVPQVVVPGAYWDEDAVGSFVDRSGAGRRVPATGVATDLSEALDEVLTDPAFTAGADGLAAELAAVPGPADVAAALPRLVEEHS